MKRTVFYEIHRRAGAKLVEFAGFEMPVEYSGVTDEHLTVREKAGVFDVSHMGEIWVKGGHARDFVQKVTTNDVDRLTPGKVQYSCFPNGEGGIVDDLLVYMYEKDKYLLVVNASNISKDWKWLNDCNDSGAELENASDTISQLAIQGPLATGILQKITDLDLSKISYYSFVTGTIGGIDDVIISNTGYTGAGGFELYFYNEHGPALWDAIMKAGLEEGIKPVGLAARDTLRLEMGFCLYGNDIDDTTSPIEAGLGWITKFSDNNQFIDRERLSAQKEDGVSRRLVAIEMIDRAIPRQHYEIASLHGEVIGEITSGTMSPVLKKGIGMGYVKAPFNTVGTELTVLVRKKALRAKVVKTPFIKPE
ncbi:MAG TPA: glycine cleavage system aminomethyltransferase GcvT [Bacteroidales bacterium]|nr:glycine cleavage system aminomethyltransferase GcvT [Bacteroidales bacterium]